MNAQASTDSAAGSVISLPKGGGAVGGLGEAFSPDLFTGTGNLSVPITVPAGRNGLQPALSLAYSTGSGRGTFGLGWHLGLPGVTRKTSRGVPRYVDAPGTGGERADVFLLAGAEDLVPVGGSYPGRVRYRPRTEGVFARIEHVKDGTSDFWEVYTKDGTRTRYGTPRPADAPDGWRDPAVVADPDRPGHVFGWRITETADPPGNLIHYAYRRDVSGRSDQPVLARIAYADYGDRADPAFLVAVDFEYSARPDPFSDFRAGFEIRTSLRCDTIRVTTHAADGIARVQREYRLGYGQAGFNGASLLTSVTAVGLDGPAVEPLPPLTFAYSTFDPAGRRFEPVTGPDLPPTALNAQTLALVDLRGAGLPDVVELGTVRRFWRNTGGGRFASARTLTEAPPFALGQTGVHLMDADGDGRPDLVVTRAPAAGYFPMTFAGTWSGRSFQAYRQVPAVNLADPTVRLVDLDGDGLTDVLRSGTRLRAWFNDPDPALAWRRTAAGDGPDVDLADPRIRLADMTGDGLSDLVLLRSGNIAYWPNLGHGRWGAMVTMRDAPRFPDGYDPRRLLLGDVDGDGVADLVYVDDGRVLVWGNHSGHGWTPAPVTVRGTPRIVDTDAIDLTDLHGTGVVGLLYSRNSDGTGRAHVRFLDLTGGVKPYLLTGTDNHMGARTTVSYRSSTMEYLRDAADPATRWRTTLPMPVHVVTKMEIADLISGGRLTTEYRYHHGYWDGVEREFRGFAMVEHLDTETFQHQPDGPDAVPAEHFSPPTLTRTWFHPGPVAAVEAGDWTELDLTHEYWPDDPAMLTRPPELTAFLAGLPRPARRGALRALRGQALRTELYARDSSDREDRPYTVTETVLGVRAEAPGIYFPFTIATRTTEWERGVEPMTRFTFSGGHDAYGFATRQLAVAVPRGRDPMAHDDGAAEPYLATYDTTEFARRDDPGRYLVDRVARTTTFEVANDGRPSVAELRDAVLGGPSPVDGLALRAIGHTRTFYDGEAFVGLPLGTLGDHGLPVRVEDLAFTASLFEELGATPPYLQPGPVDWTEEYPPDFREATPPLAGYLHYGETDVPGSPGGYYVATQRHRYDGHEPGRVARGLPIETLDPLGSTHLVAYDPHDLLPVRAVDAVGLVTSAELDYRLLTAHTVTDVNGNTESVTYSPAGLVTARFRRGKDGEGDRDLPGTRIEHDLLAFTEHGQPVSALTVQRVHHDTDPDVPTGLRDEALVTVEFTDGSGRVLQTRTRIEDTLFGDPTFGGEVLPADQSVPPGGVAGRTRDESAPDNVAVSGWQVYDNKGRVVRRYEPFFSTGYEYDRPGEAQLGQHTALFYDPLGRLVRTAHPDGSEERTVLGVPVDLADPDGSAPTPWERYTYDANDNAGRTHPATTQAYSGHWNTPASEVLDALGRAVTSVARNGRGAVDEFTTRSAYDIQGNLVSVTDALGRIAFRHVHDLIQRPWRVDGIDSGRRDTVVDGLGNPIERRDGKGALMLAAFDVLHRPSRAWARDVAGGALTLRQLTEYGDGGTTDQPAEERAAARSANLLGHPVRTYDEAGLLTIGSIDFKDNLVRTSRRVFADEVILATYDEGRKDGWQVPAFTVDWRPAAGETRSEVEARLLAPGGYTSGTVYDALDRPVRHTLPGDVEGRRREIRLAYNRAGHLDQVSLDDTVHVRRMAYDAKGQRSLIVHGNDTMTRYAYDRHTFRLVRLRTDPYTQPDDDTYEPKGPAIQDVGHDYDLVGNLVAVRDRTPGSGLPGNPAALNALDPALRRALGAGDALDRAFSYDPTYRLLSATGREAAGPPPGPPWTDQPRGADPTRAQAYEESYTYDPVGSLLRLVHASASGFTRDFTVTPASNRLQRLTVGTTPYEYGHDANGNLRTETTARRYGWNHADRMTTFAVQTGTAEPSVHAHYLYDAAGLRVTKLVRRQGGAFEVTHYLNEIFEHHRWSGPDPGANNQVHVLDDHRRVATVRLGPARPDDRGPATAYHFADHLCSSTVVVDGDGTVVNREEYAPYGETTFGSYTRKRYRFTGKERDEESSLSYHRARYYAPWLGRWVNADPVGAAGGLNQYEYCAGNPMRLVDPAGTAPNDQLGAALKGFEQAMEASIQAYNDYVRNIGGLENRHMAAEANVNREYNKMRDWDMKDPKFQRNYRRQERRYKAAVGELNKVRQQIADLKERMASTAQRVTQARERVIEVQNNMPKSGGGGKRWPWSRPTKRAPDPPRRGPAGPAGPSGPGRPRGPGPSGLGRPSGPGTSGLGRGPGPGGLPPIVIEPPEELRPQRRDFYGDDDLIEGGLFLVSLFRRDWKAVGIGVVRCATSEHCRDVMSAVPTGGLPGTMIVGGGYHGRLRNAGDANRELQLRERQ